MAAAVSIISRCGFRIEICNRNKPNKNKLAMFKL